MYTQEDVFMFILHSKEDWLSHPKQMEHWRGEEHKEKEMAIQHKFMTKDSPYHNPWISIVCHVPREEMDTVKLSQSLLKRHEEEDIKPYILQTMNKVKWKDLSFFS